MDMEQRSHLKRPLPEDDGSTKPPPQKKVRFPKGKKVKAGDEQVAVSQTTDIPTDLSDPQLAALERAKRRGERITKISTEESGEIFHDISAAELRYEDDEDFVDDGIQMEPFNLNKEREEGYFDPNGNYVEYVNENEIKDAWLDNIDVEPKFAERNSTSINDEDEIPDLSSEDIAKMKRRIADLLEPGETVLQALRRLKGNSNNRKEKMSAETKRLFDQLTEDSMKLMEGGDYNVYHEKQEVFEREAEGYERLVRARGGETSIAIGHLKSDSGLGKDLFSTLSDPGSSSTLPETSVGPSGPNNSIAEIPSSNDADEFDMFAEDDETATANPSSDRNNSVPIPDSSTIIEQPLEFQNTDGYSENDYVYDESSGYYYSSSLGYYYDPSSGLYCSATSGQWYSYNEEMGTYDEIQGTTSSLS